MSRLIQNVFLRQLSPQNKSILNSMRGFVFDPEDNVLIVSTMGIGPYSIFGPRAMPWGSGISWGCWVDFNLTKIMLSTDHTSAFPQRVYYKSAYNDLIQKNILAGWINRSSTPLSRNFGRIGIPLTRKHYVIVDNSNNGVSVVVQGRANKPFFYQYP